MHSIMFHEEVWGGVLILAAEGPPVPLPRKSIENPLLINVSPCTIPHLRDTNFALTLSRPPFVAVAIV